MPSEDVELLRRVVDAYNRRDIDTYVALMDPNVEIISRFGGHASYHGHDGVRAYLQDWLGTFPDLTIEIEEVRDVGGRLLFALRARGHGASSDAPFRELFWTTAKALDGKCVWWHAHASKAEALAAVPIVLREITREAADALLVGERPCDVHVADDYPTEFSSGVAQYVGAEGQFGPFFLHRSEDDLVVGEIGGAFVDDEGTIEIGYAVVESQWNRGYATAGVGALVTKARAAPEVRRIVAHTPLERPESGRVLEKAGFAMVREMDDSDRAGNVMRVKEWELAV